MNSFFLPQTEGEDSIYKEIRDGDKFPDLEWRKHIEELWESFGPYANSQFREDVQKQFFPFWWEMYLGSTLLKNGFKLQMTRIEEPDLCVQNEKGKIWLEATMPQRGDGDDRVPEIQSLSETGGQASRTPEEKIILRYTSSVREKNLQYIERLKNGICEKTNPYIVAIHNHYLFHKSHPGTIPYIAKALYPVGSMFVDFFKDGAETETGYSNREKISKKNQVDVKTSIFLYEGEDDYKGISGVLYSHKEPCQLTTRPPKEDYIFIHNHLAKNPIPLGSFNFAVEYFIEEKEESLELKPL